MRTVERKPAKGSRRWLQEAVSARSAMSGVLDERIRQVCGLPARVEIKWCSPLEEDGYVEHRDHGFLTLLELKLEHRPLESFWPNCTATYTRCLSMWRNATPLYNMRFEPGAMRPDCLSCSADSVSLDCLVMRWIP